MKCYSVPLVGEQHYRTGFVGLREGDVAHLLPEPDNPHDERAIKVKANGTIIGYLPKGGWLTRAILDDGEDARAIVMEIVPPSADRDFFEAVLQVNLAGIDMTAADLPPLLNLPPSDLFAPLVGLKLTVQCGCGNAYQIPIKGLTPSTILTCPSCGGSREAGTDITDPVEEQFYEAVLEICDDLNLPAPNDDQLDCLLRTGRFPSRAART